MKNQANMISPKETNKVSATDYKEIEIHELFNKEFKISIVKMFNELKENSNN